MLQENCHWWILHLFLTNKNTRKVSTNKYFCFSFPTNQNNLELLTHIGHSNMTLNKPYWTSKAARVMFSMKSLKIPPPSMPASSTPNSFTNVTRICKKTANSNYSGIKIKINLLSSSGDNNKGAENNFQNYK